MAMNVLIRATLVAVLALAGTQPVAAQDTAGATARQLSRAVIAGIGLGLEQGEAKGNVDPAVAACVRAIDPLSMEPTYRRVIEANFSPSEIATLDAHYGSPIGDLDWRTAINMLREQNGMPVNEPLTLTAAQQAQIDAFLTSDVGMRLNAITGEDGKTKRIIEEDIARVLQPCF